MAKRPRCRSGTSSFKTITKVPTFLRSAAILFTSGRWLSRVAAEGRSPANMLTLLVLEHADPVARRFRRLPDRSDHLMSELTPWPRATERRELQDRGFVEC